MPIRNLRTPKYGSDNAYHKFAIWTIREIFLAGGWTEVENNGDAAWASNVLQSYSDLYVEAGQTGRVRRTSDFTPPTGTHITLIDATYPGNSIIAEILGYDLHTLQLNMRNVPAPFVPSTGIVGRVHSCGQTSLLAAGAWTVLRAPGTSPTRFEIRLAVDSSAIAPRLYGYPCGDYATTRAITTGMWWSYGGTERRAIYNADFDDENFMLYTWLGYSGTSVGGPYVWAGGRLQDTRAGDDHACFITGNLNTGTGGGTYPAWDWQLGWPVYMVGKLLEPVTGYMDFPKIFSGDSYTSSIWHYSPCLLQEAKTPRQNPRVVMEDSIAGGYYRGRLPWEAIHTNWPDWVFADSEGTLRSSEGKLLIPAAGRNGCDILTPLAAFTA